MKFLISSLLKFLASVVEGIIHLNPFQAKISVQVRSKKAKKVVFKPVTLLLTQFPLKTKFLTAVVLWHTKQTKGWADWST